MHNGRQRPVQRGKALAVCVICVVINVVQDAGRRQTGRRQTMGDALLKIVQLFVFSMEEGGP